MTGFRGLLRNDYVAKKEKVVRNRRSKLSLFGLLIGRKTSWLLKDFCRLIKMSGSFLAKADQSGFVLKLGVFRDYIVSFLHISLMFS